MKKPAFVFQIDPIEMALRIAEEAIDLRRPEGTNAQEAWAEMVEHDPKLADQFMRIGRRAAEYVAECITAPGIHAKVQ